LSFFAAADFRFSISRCAIFRRLPLPFPPDAFARRCALIAAYFMLSYAAARLIVYFSALCHAAATDID